MSCGEVEGLHFFHEGQEQHRRDLGKQALASSADTRILSGGFPKIGDPNLGSL